MLATSLSTVGTYMFIRTTKNFGIIIMSPSADTSFSLMKFKKVGNLFKRTENIKTLTQPFETGVFRVNQISSAILNSKTEDNDRRPKK